MKLSDVMGVMEATFAYIAYGELLSVDATLTRFLYNGRGGVSTDDNGLYYMHQRYYNTEIKRFVNQDILTGSAGNSQSLNRYSYVQGNPVKYTDPFGLSPINGLFSGSNIRHDLLGFASCIPVMGVIASAADAWYYYKKGNTAMAMACTVDAVIGLLSGGGSLLTKFSQTEQIGRAIQVAAKIGNGGVGLYRNATTFGKSAVDFYVRHEGTFFTRNFQWELADAGDFLSMALSGAGAAQSAAGLVSGINEAAKAYRQWEIKLLSDVESGKVKLRTLSKREQKFIANELRNRSPVAIPADVDPVIKYKNGYDQIAFKWSEGDYTYEVRWHDATPNAPENTIPNWRVDRKTLGSPGGRDPVTRERIQGRRAIEEVLIWPPDTEPQYISRGFWEECRTAYQEGTATERQIEILKWGHFVPK